MSLNSISKKKKSHKTKHFLHSKALTNSTLNEFCCNKNYYYWKVVNNSYTCMYCFQIYKYITLCIVLNKQRNIALILNIYCDTKSTVVIVLVFDVHCGVRDWTWPSCYYMYMSIILYSMDQRQLCIDAMEMFICVPGFYWVGVVDAILKCAIDGSSTFTTPAYFHFQIAVYSTLKQRN